ncbi:MAG: PadR family transcriptional regulator [Candidatus Bilamarchaeaceae archaeon]
MKVEDKLKEETSPLRRLKHHLTSGNIWLYILSLLKKEKVYAYALDSEIEKRFGFKPNKIMIYIVLYKLEAEGLIQSTFDGRRKYYKITEKGKNTIENGKNYLKELMNKI